jgi:hypothetical protein
VEGNKKEHILWNFYPAKVEPGVKRVPGASGLNLEVPSGSIKNIPGIALCFERLLVVLLPIPPVSGLPQLSIST